MRLQLTDDYKVRNEILRQLQRHASNWFELALSRAPVELQATLQVFVFSDFGMPNKNITSLKQRYLAATQSLAGSDTSELGASMAERFAKAFGPPHRQLSEWRCDDKSSFSDLSASLRSLSNWDYDRAKVLASQLASKSYFAGEAAGLRLASRKGRWSCKNSHSGSCVSHAAQDILDKVPPQNATLTDILALKEKLEDTMNAILQKTSTLTVQDLKRLLFRCAATLIALDKVYTNDIVLKFCDPELIVRVYSPPLPRCSTIRGVYTICHSCWY